MNDQSDTPAPRGHNNPPELLPVLPGDATPEQLERARQAAEAPAEIEGLIAYDASKHAELAAHVAVFCDAAGLWLDIKTIQSAEQAERLTDFVTGARALFKRVEDARKAAKKQWDDLGAQVQLAYSPQGDKLKKIADSMKAMMADWLRRENARIAAEKAEAERKAREAREAAERAAAEAAARNDISGQVEAEAALKEAAKAEKQAAKPAKAQAGSATGGGRTMGLRKQRFARIDNINLAFAYFRNNREVHEVLNRLANQAVRAGDLTEKNAPTFGMSIIEQETAA